MDYELFLSLVEEELDYLQENDLSYELDRLKAAGALVVLQEYLQDYIQPQPKGTEAAGRAQEPRRKPPGTS